MSNNYVLGRGEIRFDKLDPDSLKLGTLSYLGERYFGNTTQFDISIETQSLDHYDSDHGINVMDDTVDTQIDRTGAIACDNIDSENLALFYQGQVIEVAQTSGTVSAETVGDATLGVSQGLYYQLGRSDANPQGVRGVSAVTVAETGGPTTYTAGTDYVLDPDLGTIYIVPGGAIADGTVLDDVDYTTAANTRSRSISGNAALYGALRFISYNPKGVLRDVFIPYCKITPNGAHSWKGEDWQVLNYNVTVLEPGNGKAAIYIDGRPATA